MTGSPTNLDVYLEVGKKRTFAGAIEWPGWCRSGRDEAATIEALMVYGPRYERALRGTKLGFRTPADAASFEVTERLEGDATTDFGAPGVAPSADARPVDDVELRRLVTLLKASWRAFDAAVASAKGVELKKGPRGGGRELDAIVEHVLGADRHYLPRLGVRPGRDPEVHSAERLAATRRPVLDALDLAVRDGVPEEGPRGGSRWTPRYFVRRVAWHVLDHAWEIEDRAT